MAFFISIFLSLFIHLRFIVAESGGQSKIPVVIIADPGVDDTAALLLALSAPSLDILGICSNFGVVDSVTAAKNALLVLNRADKHTIPVFLGADHPIGELPRATRGAPAGRTFHGPAGFGKDIPDYNALKVPINSSLTAVEFLIRTTRSRPGQVTILVFSPLTTLALAVISDLSFATNVKSVYVMGGAVFVPGNTSPLAEANFANDAAAAALVVAQFSNKLTVAPLDATLQVLYSEHDLLVMANGRGIENRWFATKLAPYYLSSYRGIAGGACSIDGAQHSIECQSTPFMPMVRS